MGFAPIKWTCTAFFRPRQLTDRAILANRQTQEKKSLRAPGWAGWGEPGFRGGSCPGLVVFLLLAVIQDM